MTHTTDLTHGNIKKQLAAIAIPLIIGNILQQLYNTIDAVVIGRYLGNTAFAAIGVAGTVMNLFIFILSGCCAGVAVILGQLFGGGDVKGFRNEFFLAAAFGCGFTIILSIAGITLIGPLFNLIQTPQDVAAFGRDYLIIIFCGLITTYLYNLSSAVLRSVGNTNAALVILAFSIVLNLALDMVFVAALGFGIAGAAWATVISQLISVILSVVYMRIKLGHLMFKRADMSFDGAMLRKTANYGVVSALHQSSLYIGKLLVQGAVNGAGIDMISAYTATARIEGFANTIGDSAAAGVSVFVAQNHGADNKERVGQVFRSSLLIMAILSVVMSVIMMLTAYPAVSFMLGGDGDIGMALEFGAQYMTMVSFFYLFNYLGSVFVGYYRGVGLVSVPVIGTTFHLTLRVVLSYLLINRMGLSAVALASGLGWITVVTFQSSLYLVLRHKRKKKGESGSDC